MNAPINGGLNQSDEAELARLGIERVTVQMFHWGGFRYTNIRDAIAAATRGQER
jgi:hypothetical protein